MAKKKEAKKPIGAEEVREAYKTFMDYKGEKANLDKRIVENEKIWKMEHWDFMTDNPDDKRVKPRSAWLVNTILNKHADSMDNYPEANILPRARDDEEAARILSKVIPTVLENCEFQNTFSDEQWDKIKNGTGLYGVFWNNDLNNGLGDIDIKDISIPNFFWKGGIDDIQDSPNVFYVTMEERDELKKMYPDIEFKGSGNVPIEATELNQSESVDNSSKVAVIDWYYKKAIRFIDANGLMQNKTILHYCKFCEGNVLFASENEHEYAEKGFYAHGKYPFVVDALYPLANSVSGFGYIDLVKDDQMFTDKLRQAILENAVANAAPRNCVRTDSGVNEQELNDPGCRTVHFEGNLGEDAFRQLVASPLSGIYETVYRDQIQQMKDTSGNTAASQGQTSSVTSASGIASLQEAAGKLSRDSNLGAYRAYKKVVEMVIELIREFYTEERSFRIVGEDGDYEFVNFDNSMIAPESQDQAFGIDLGSRLPIFDIVVKPQKQSAYSRESQNQTALNLYNMGFFAPNNTDAALSCLEMMDFEEIQKVKDKIKMNGTLLDKVMKLQQLLLEASNIIDTLDPSKNFTQQVAMVLSQDAAMGDGRGSGSPVSVETSRGSLSAQAANATKNSTAPR